LKSDFIIRKTFHKEKANMKNAFSKLIRLSSLILFTSLLLTSWKSSTLPGGEKPGHGISACSPLNDRPSTEIKKQ